MTHAPLGSGHPIPQLSALCAMTIIFKMRRDKSPASPVRSGDSHVRSMRHPPHTTTHSTTALHCLQSRTLHQTMARRSGTRPCLFSDRISSTETLSSRRTIKCGLRPLFTTRLGSRRDRRQERAKIIRSVFPLMVLSRPSTTPHISTDGRAFLVSYRLRVVAGRCKLLVPILERSQATSRLRCAKKGVPVRAWDPIF